MARFRGLQTLCAALGVFVAALMPQPGFTDPSAIDLSQLRAALRAVETDILLGVNAPVNVSEVWANLPLSNDMRGSIATTITTFAPAAKAIPVFGESFANASGVDTPTVTAEKPEQRIGNAFVSIKVPSTTFIDLVAPNPEVAQPAPQDVEALNFRMMLVTLLQNYSGQNATAVVNAQGLRGPMAVVVRTGTVSLADIQSYAASFGMPPRADGTMTAPVVIWPGATLRLEPGQRLSLARDAGAFILSMGTLDIDGAIIEVSGPKNPHTPSFSPFVTVADGGSLIMKGATVRGLGFGQTAKFSGLSVASSLLSQNKGKVVIQDSLFDGLLNLTIAGVPDAMVSGNTFINARGTTLSLINAPNTVIENNFFAGGSHTNSVRVDSGSHNTKIGNNIFLLGERVAMMVTGSSDNVQAHHNLVWKRQGAGIKFFNTRCGIAQGNIILDNRQKGIEIRSSDGTVAKGNMIAGNRSAGIWVSGQSRNARTLLNANVLVGNASGLSTATGAEILMDGNDFSNQLPRLLHGDIARLTKNVAVDMRGAKTLRFKNGQAEQGVKVEHFCGNDL